MVEERTLIALYKTIDAAEITRRRLIDLGLAEAQVSISGEERAGSTADYPPENGGFFQALKDLFLPDRDLYTYDAGLRRGAKMVSAHVPGQLVDQVREIMEREDPLDIDMGETDWRSAGLGDYGTRRSDADEREREVRHRDQERSTPRVRSYMR